MPFEGIIKRHLNPNTKYYLEEKTYTNIKDELGDRQKKWIRRAELTGIIRSPRTLYGEGAYGYREAGADLKGYFIASSNIDPSRLPYYRILAQHTNSDGTKTNICYRITSIDRDLYRRGRRNHYEIELVEDPDCSN
ncbi:hypothetical protein [Methanobacterium virus PhiF1]|nr:hypothetical protein [Methanobacterium virus PhiF1]